MLVARKSAIIAALCCAVAMRGNAQSPTISTTEAGGGPERSAALAGRVFRALIQPMNNSTVTGTVMMAPSQQMGVTTVVVSLVGAEPGTYYWHLHVGPCSEPGALLGDRSDYMSIKVGTSGRATLRDHLDVAPPSGGNYHVIIHRSSDPKDEAHIVACGELLETGV